MSNYRDRKLLDLAHRVTECQGCGKYCPDGCEPAHSNSMILGKGASIKAHDNFHAALCHECHVGIDSGRKSGEDAAYDWARAHFRTMLLYFRNGWIKVAKAS